MKGSSKGKSLKKVVKRPANKAKTVKNSVRKGPTACSICDCSEYVQPDVGHKCARSTCGHYSGKHTG